MTDGLLAEWSQWMRAAGLSPRTIDERVQLVERLEAHIDSASPRASWQQLADYLGRAPTAGTRQTYYANLRAYYKWLVLMEHRADDPTAKLPIPKAPRRRARPFSTEQISQILDTRMHHRTRAMVLLGAYAGLRVHEIAKLRGSDLRFGHLHVVGKGEVYRRVPIHPLVDDMAASMPRGLWFAARTRPGPILAKSVTDMISKLIHRAGIIDPRLTPHSLRHFFGTELRRGGADLDVVQELLGHASVATTVLYTELDANALTAAVARLPLPDRFAA